MRSILAGLVVLAASALAQLSDAGERCFDTAMTQAAMNQCAAEEARRADAERQSVYARLLEAAHAEDPTAVQKVTAAEKAWEAYRDAYLDAMYPAEEKQREYGSIYPLDLGLLRADLTRKHVEELKHLLLQYIDPEEARRR